MEKAQAELCPSKPQYPAHRWVWVCSTGVGARHARGRPQQGGNSGRGAGQSRALAHLQSSRSQPKQRSGKKSSNALITGRQPHSWEQTSFKLPDSDSQQPLWRGFCDEVESSDRNTSPGLPSNALFSLSQRHDEVYWGHLISLHHRGISSHYGHCLFPHRCEFKSALYFGNYPATTFFSIPSRKKVPV